jgi:multidrug transporter EmrE-like cation transporter
VKIRHYAKPRTVSSKLVKIVHMKNELIQQSIYKEKIQLTFSEKLIHYRLSIIIFIISIICLANVYESILSLNIDYGNIYIRIGFALIILSLISLVSQKLSLNLKKVEINETSKSLSEKILMVAKMRNWKIEHLNDNAIILTTSRPFSSGRYFVSKSFGEKVFVFFKPKEILLKSNHDLSKSLSFVVSSGENKENEKQILNIIKASC